MAEFGDYSNLVSEAEQKLRNGKRERLNRISSIMGQYLLKGYTMLDETCVSCDTILLRSRQGQYHCVGCLDVDNDTAKDDPAVNMQAAISHFQELKSTCSKDIIDNISSIQKVEQILKEKLLSTSILLTDSTDVEYEIKLTKLIQILIETLGYINKMKL